MAHVEGKLLAETALGAWLIASGGSVHASLRYRRGPYGLGLQLEEPAAAGTELVSCPFELAVTPSLARRQLGGRLPVEASDHVATCAYLALHRSLPSDPTLVHVEYVATLPLDNEMRTPSYFTDDEYALLSRTNVYAAGLERKEGWRAEAATLDPALSIDWPLYLWACTVLSSRAFPSHLLDGDREHATPILLPGVDTLNHRRGERVGWISSDKALSLVTDAALEPNQELFNNYGLKSNEEWLFGYGFTVRDNPDDVVSLRLAKSDRVHNVPRDGIFPRALLAELRELVSDPEADEHENRLNLLDTLGDMLRAKLAKLEEPIETGDDVRPDVREHVATYRQGQLDVLRAAIAHQGELFELALEAASEAGVDVGSDSE